VLTGKVVGTNDDDFLEIRLRLPITDNSVNVGFTNMYVKLGEDIDDYPYETYDLVRAKIRALDIPEGTNTDNYQSLTYVTSTSQSESSPNFNGGGFFAWMSNPPIGTVLLWLTTTAPNGYLLCHGGTYSKAGLYANLFDVIGYNHTYRYGLSFANQTTDTLRTYADDIGAVATANTADPGITLTTVTPGAVAARQVVDAQFGAASAIAHLATFTLHTPNGNFLFWFNKDSVYVPYSSIPFTASYYVVEIQIATGDTATQVRDKVRDTISAITTGGTSSTAFLSTENFTTSVSTITVTATNQRIGAVKSSPSSGTSGFTVTVTTSGSPTTYEVTTIDCVDAASLSASDYFTISTNSYDIVFWVLKDGVGTKPSVSGDYFIPFIVSTGEAAADVAATLHLLMNYVFYQIPDVRDMFPRFFSDASANNPWHAATDTNRSGRPDQTTGEVIGTLQHDELHSHDHTTDYQPDTIGSGSGEDGITQTTANDTVVANTGGTETRPKNFLFNAIVKY
jgi:hypothetical protein